MTGCLNFVFCNSSRNCSQPHWDLRATSRRKEAMVGKKKKKKAMGLSLGYCFYLVLIFFCVLPSLMLWFYFKIWLNRMRAVWHGPVLDQSCTRLSWDVLMACVALFWEFLEKAKKKKKKARPKSLNGIGSKTIPPTNSSPLKQNWNVR